jgi:hypothetical protein
MPDTLKDSLPPADHEVQGQVIYQDQDLGKVHQRIDSEVARATNQKHEVGGSIPPFQTDPLEVINPEIFNPHNEQEQVDAITPQSYKRQEVPAPLKKFFKLFGNFGKDTQATYEQVATGKSYRSTDGNEFIKEINKKKQQGNPLAELKKAA